MNQDIKTKWLEALRSGEYEQGMGYLSSNGRYCCLGVLCEIAVSEGVVEKEQRDDLFIYGEESNAGTLPREVKDWAGIEADNPQITIDGIKSVAAMHNDNYRCSFEQIAQGIEDSL